MLQLCSMSIIGTSIHPFNVVVLFTDVNECEEKQQACNVNAVCTNNIGSYRCTCHDGFYTTDDGATCIGRCRLPLLSQPMS